ncbi:MAG: glycosyltransferase family 2 protein [Candidatus Magasanikbacteria bacterium]
MIFIVIPAYNEENKIGRVVRGLFEQGWRNVLVVDDGSTDNTADIARRAGAQVVCHSANCGQGSALQTGDDFACHHGAQAVVHFDADDQFNPADISGAIDIIKSNQADVVLGSRFLDNRSQVPWVKRYIILPVSRWINFMFTGVLLTDAHNGFRVLSRPALEKIRITQAGMAHNSEIVRQIKKYHLKFVEFPVEVRYHEFGQGIGEGVNIVKDLVVDWFIK